MRIDPPGRRLSHLCHALHAPPQNVPLSMRRFWAHLLQLLSADDGRTLVGTAMILLLIVLATLTLLTALGQSTAVQPPP